MPGTNSQSKKILLFCASAAMVATITAIDYFTGPEYSLLPFYLVPVLHSAWFIGRRAGVFISFLCVLLWFWTHYILMPETTGAFVPYWNALARLGIFLIVTYIISIQSALKRALENERLRSRTDFTTGALNSRAFNEMADVELRRARRYDRPLSLAFLDLDNFKAVNDDFGHNVGDILLRKVVETIRTHIRASDVLARVGGDEFVILFPETGAASATAVVEKLQMAFTNEMEKEGWPVTMSIGVITCTGFYPALDEILSKADALMYEAKQAGKRASRYATIRKAAGA